MLNRTEAIEAVIARMNDGSLIDREIYRDDDGYFMSDIGEAGRTVRIPTDDGSIEGDLATTAEALLDLADAAMLEFYLG